MPSVITGFRLSRETGKDCSKAVDVSGGELYWGDQGWRNALWLGMNGAGGVVRLLFWNESLAILFVLLISVISVHRYRHKACRWYG